MKILILGAGQVGTSVAAALSIEEENDRARFVAEYFDASRR